MPSFSYCSRAAQLIDLESCTPLDATISPSPAPFLTSYAAASSLSVLASGESVSFLPLTQLVWPEFRRALLAWRCIFSLTPFVRADHGSAGIWHEFRASICGALQTLLIHACSPPPHFPFSSVFTV